MLRSSSALLSIIFLMPAVAEEAQTSGACSPIVKTIGGIANVTIQCSGSLSRKEIARNNLSEMVSALKSIYGANGLYLMPSLKRFMHEPTDANWRVLSEDTARIKKALDAAIDSSVRYFGDIEVDGNRGPKIAQVLKSRDMMLLQLAQSAASVESSTDQLRNVSARLQPAASKPLDLVQWQTTYYSLMHQTLDLIRDLEADLRTLDAGSDKQVK